MNSNSSAKGQESILEGDERWLLAQRIASSPLLSKSQRLAVLLLYLVEKTLHGKADLLTEQKIAAEVFLRPADFDPTVDTIVRSHMVRLRQKVNQYTAEHEEGNLKLLIPKGGYGVIFERCSQPRTLPSESPSLECVPSPSNEQQPPARMVRLKIVSFTLAILCAILAILLILSLHALREKTQPQASTHPLWSAFLQPNQKTIFVAADSSFVLLHRFTKRALEGNTSPLPEYINHDYEKWTRNLPPDVATTALSIAAKRYTSYVDVSTLHRLDMLYGSRPKDIVARYARDIHIGDLKDGNIILSGARDANPWVEMFEPEMNFYKEIDTRTHITSFINRHPQPGEEQVYATFANDPKQRVLGVLALLPNLSGTGKVLIIEGSNLAGTETISDFLFEDSSLLPFLKKIQRPDGSIPYFEVLLESRDFDDNAGRFHILTYRIH